MDKYDPILYELPERLRHVYFCFVDPDGVRQTVVDTSEPIGVLIGSTASWRDEVPRLPRSASVTGQSSSSLGKSAGEPVEQAAAESVMRRDK